jgi:hypothetical protein
MIKTKFVEDTYDYASNFVAAIPGKGNRLEEHVQRLFVVTSVERRESAAEIRHSATFERNPSR